MDQLKNEHKEVLVDADKIRRTVVDQKNLLNNMCLNLETYLIQKYNMNLKY